VREYGQVQSAFWQHASEEGWSDDAKLISVYLLTGPHTNGLGSFRLPSAYVTDDLGWSLERVETAFQELNRNGFCERFGAVVVIPKFLRWNPISNPKVAKARQNEFGSLPSREAKEAAARAMLELGSHWSNEFRARLESLSKRSPKEIREGNQ